jgi:hypothetical protein
VVGEDAGKVRHMLVVLSYFIRCNEVRPTVRVCRQKFTLEDAIGSHTCSEAIMRVTNNIHPGCPHVLPVGTVNCV